MPLTLYVDAAAWRDHLLAEVAREPGLVPVAKGNGYGFTVPLLTRAGAALGVARIAVGTAADAAVALRSFGGDVIVLDPQAETSRLLPDLGGRVMYTADSVRANPAAGRFDGFSSLPLPISPGTPQVCRPADHPGWGCDDATGRALAQSRPHPLRTLTTAFPHAAIQLVVFPQ